MDDDYRNPNQKALTAMIQFYLAVIVIGIFAGGVVIGLLAWGIYALVTWLF